MATIEATLDVLNPATGESIGEVPNSGADEVDEASSGRRPRSPEWLDATPGERAELLLKLADVISDNAEELAQIESRNVGKPIGLAREEMPFAADNLRFFAGAARNLEGKSTGEYIKRLHVDDPPRADRRRRRHLPVELPADDGGLEDGPGARSRQRADPEAVRADAVVAAPLRRAREGRDPGGGAPGRHRRRRPDRRAARRASRTSASSRSPATSPPAS